MSARRRKKGGHHEEEHENEERWLVSFADMMTLLFCLFMVLFAISSVNTSKFEALQKALQDAFSGKILSGGEAVMETGNDKQPEKPGTEPPLPAMTPLQAMAEQLDPERRRRRKSPRRTRTSRSSRQRIDALVAKEGLTGKVETTVRKRGLVVELLTDNVFFDSGQADAQARRPEPARQARRRAQRRAASTRSSSRVTPTRSRSPTRSTRATGSCPAPARRRSSEPLPLKASRAAGCLARCTAPKTRPPATRPPKGARATGAST